MLFSLANLDGHATFYPIQSHHRTFVRGLHHDGSSVLVQLWMAHNNHTSGHAAFAINLLSARWRLGDLLPWLGGLADGNRNNRRSIPGKRLTPLGAAVHAARRIVRRGHRGAPTDARRRPALCLLRPLVWQPRRRRGRKKACGPQPYGADRTAPLGAPSSLLPGTGLALPGAHAMQDALLEAPVLGL